MTNNIEKLLESLNYEELSEVSKKVHELKLMRIHAKIQVGDVPLPTKEMIDLARNGKLADAMKLYRYTFNTDLLIGSEVIKYYKNNHIYN